MSSRAVLDRLLTLTPAQREAVLRDTPPADLLALEQSWSRDLTLREFIRLAWPVVEPATPFVPGWHLDCIADHLEAVTSGQIRNLLLNVPPRHGKSLLVSVFWPVWEWTRNPARKWLFSSYALPLSIRDSLKCRRLIESTWFQSCYSQVFQLTTDQNTKMRFDNDHMGYRLATSVDSSNTGEGADVLAVDDPHNVREGESDIKREAAILWWDEVMSTRVNDPKTSSKVIVMQRVHQTDLSGHVLELGGYHHVCLPAAYEPRLTSIPSSAQDLADGPASVSEAPDRDPEPHDSCAIYKDPRTKEGELIWPERFGPREIEELKHQLNSSYAISGQLQQRPAPREGAMFKSTWFLPYPSPSEFAELRSQLNVVTYYDLAYSKKESADYTAGVTIGIDPRTQHMYIMNVWRDRIEETALDTTLADQIMFQRPLIVGLELGAYKQAATKDLVRRLATILSRRNIACTITAIPVTADKVFRAQLPAGRAEGGFIHADRSAKWWRTFETELLRFPKGAKDDQVDAFSGGVQLAIERGRPLSRKSSPVIFGSATGRSASSDDPFNIPRAIRQHLALVASGRG